MEPAKICRICLNTEDIKMYPYNIFHSYYIDFLNLTDKYNISNLPQFICYECSALLVKCFSFKNKCLRSLKLLLECVDNGQVITSRMLELDRNANNLQSNLQFWKQTNRVKVIEIKYEDYALESVDTKIELGNINDISNIGEKESQELKIELCYDTTDHGDVFDETITFVESITCVEPNTFVDIEPIKSEDTKIAKEIFIEPFQVTPEVTDTSKVITNKRKSKNDSLKTKKLKVPSKKSISKMGSSRKKNIVIDDSKWKVVILTEEQAIEKFNARQNGFWYGVAPYKCDLCFKGFSAENSFKDHQRIHNSEISGILECKFCKLKMKHISRYNTHIKTHYEEYHCLKCPYVGTTWNGARYHEDMHYGKGYSCQTCNETFAHSSSYHNHLRVAHRSQHICSECGESFVTPNGVTMHRARVHKIYTKRKTKVSQEMAILEKELERKGERYCRECDVNFTSDAAYDKHLLSSENHAVTSTNFHCDSQEKPQEEFKPLKNYRPPREKVWPIIAKSMKDASKADKKKTWSRSKPTKSTHCKECGQFFASVKECSAHHNALHPNKPFYPMRRVICEICGKNVQYAILSTHMNKHTKKTKYECERCSKVFYIKDTLKRHMLTHTGEKPWQCSMCDKRYTQQGSLQLHVRTAHHRLPYPPRTRRPKPFPLVDQFQSAAQE